MMPQLSFDDLNRLRFGEDTIERAFARFHMTHPEVYEALLELCRDWKRKGPERWSIDGAFEVLRWQWHDPRVRDGHEEYRLNNNYRSRYARLIMAQAPDLDGLFELRALTA